MPIESESFLNNLLSYRINKSINILESLNKLCDTLYLSVSFGKDSLVLYDIAKKVFPNIHCYFLKSEETYLMYDYERVIQYYLAQGMNLTIIETNRLSENDFDWEKARKAGNKDFDLMPKNYEAYLLGLRKEESKTRFYSLTRKHNKIFEGIHKLNNGKIRCCPLLEWKHEEILLYLNMNKLPYLSVYINNSSARTTARLTGDACRNNTMQQLRSHNLSNYNHLVKNINGLRKEVK